jgi:hypothetical protein
LNAGKNAHGFRIAKCGKNESDILRLHAIRFQRSAIPSTRVQVEWFPEPRARIKSRRSHSMNSLR